MTRTNRQTNFAPYRLLSALAGAFLLTQSVVAETPTLSTKLVLATYRLEHPRANGTAFVLDCRASTDKEPKTLLLVTAAHTLEKMNGNKATIVFRKKNSDGTSVAAPTKIDIRQNGKPLWQKHEKQDVAVMQLQNPQDISVASIPIDRLATAADWKTDTPEPGDFVRVIGFPHAAQFKPSAAGFPITRLGCVASFPLTPYKTHPTFLVDYNSFEGDSGGLVYANRSETKKIIGLIHAQHMIDDKYSTTYQQGLIRKRLGLAIVVNSQAILETIDKHFEKK